MTTPSLSTQELMHQAAQAHQAGHRQQAQQILAQVVRQDPSYAPAWLQLAEVVIDPQQKQHCYERVLQLDPANSKAQQGLRGLKPPTPPSVATGPTLNLNQTQTKPVAQKPQTVAAFTGNIHIDPKQGIITGNAPYQVWINQLSTSQEQLVVTNQKRKFGFAVAAIGFITAIVGIVMASLPLIISGLIWALIVVVLTFSLVSNPVTHTKRITEVVLPFLTMLREDVDPHKPIEINLDLNATNSAPKLENQRTLEPSRRLSINEKTFVDLWFSGQARMIDGAQLRWSITDQLRERKIRKRNPRGKIKFKTKAKSKRTVSAQLALKNTYQPAAQPHGQVLSTVQFDQSKYRLNAQRKVPHASTDNSAVFVLLATIGDLYRCVQR